MSLPGFGGALGRVVRAGVGRRGVQTVAIVLSTLMAVTAAVMATALIAGTRSPFDHTFAGQHGAHLAARFDGAKASAAQIAGTAHVSGVTASAGPFPETELGGGTLNGGDDPGVAGLPPMTLVGRAQPDAAVDRLALTDGHWLTGPGQVVLSVGFLGPRAVVGATITFTPLPGGPRLTVVGIARSATSTADAWVEPDEISTLRTAQAAASDQGSQGSDADAQSPASQTATAQGPTPQYQMLYRFASADTDAQISADRDAVEVALPSGALTGSSSYLSAKLEAQSDTGPFVPFVIAFGILGLVMAVLIIGTVVSGTVGASLRRIGVLKALGFTPSQVVRAYVAQAVLPSAAGVGLGVLCGNLLAAPLLSRADSVLGTVSLSVAWWIDVVAPCAALLLVAATAFVPALRAGRLRAVQAIALGRTPTVGRGRLARRVLARLPLPRAVGLGLAGPFTRPVRTLAMAAAVVFGATAVTFAFGLAQSLHRVQTGISRSSYADVEVDVMNPHESLDGVTHVGPKGAGGGGAPDLPTPDPAAVKAAVAAQPDTASFFGIARRQLVVSGVTGTSDVELTDGAPAGTYPVIAGSWFTGPGQAVVPTRFLESTGTHLGSTIAIADAGRQVPVKIVGEVFDTRDQGMEVVTDIRTLSAVDSTLSIDEYDVKLKPGTAHSTYVSMLNAKIEQLGGHAQDTALDSDSPILLLLDAMIALLTTMLVTVAGLAVLNTVVLDTRERVHDLGVYKAVGMTPRQTIAMVLSSVAAIGLPAGILGVPAGIALHDFVLPIMGHAAGTNLPHTYLAVYDAAESVPLGLGGLVIAVLGAMLPAGWAARTRTAAALRTE